MRMWGRQALLMVCVASVALLAAGVVRAIRQGEAPATAADTAQVLGTYWTVGAGVLAFLAWAGSRWLRSTRVEPVTATSEQVEAAADLLAERILRTWSKQATARGIVTPAPVRVHWRWAAADYSVTRDELNRSPNLSVDPAPLREHDAEVLASGVVDRLHDEVYTRLRHGRLTLTGGPGAGKTGAMLLLLLAALRSRNGTPTEQRARVPVPVWLTLGSWNPVQQGLRDWVILSLQRDHPYLRAADFGPDAPARLFDTTRIALFLDGLDELPGGFRQRAMQRLREESAGLRVVITSRPNEYRNTFKAGGQLPQTAVLTMRPVRTKAAVAYLLADRTPSDIDRWTPLTDHLTAHPACMLARTLNTPLTLSLARATYEHPDTDPGLLLELDLNTSEAVRRHLLDATLAVAYPDPRKRDHAQRWLGWLAHRMATRPTGVTRDLPWWHIPTYLSRRQQLLATLVFGLMTGLVFGLMTGLVLGLMTGVPDLLFGLQFGLALGLVNGLLPGLAALLAAGIMGMPSAFARRWLKRPKVASMLAHGVAGGLLFGAVGPWPGLAFGIACGLAFDLAASLAGGRSALPQAFAPRWLKRQEVASMLGRVLAVGLAGCLAVGLLSGIEYGLADGLITGLTLGLVPGLAFLVLAVLVAWGRPTAAAADMTPQHTHDVHRRYSLAVGLGASTAGVLAILLAGQLWFAFAANVAIVVSIVLMGVIQGSVVGLSMAEIVLLLTTRCRVRFMSLLEEALDHQLLRQAGTLYQFRHAELQDRLATLYQSGHLDPSSAVVGR